MIDISTERLLAIRQVCDRVPGKRGVVVYHTVWHWMRQGVRGVKLESVRVGGRVYSSEEALKRFLAALSGGGDDEAAGPVAQGGGPRRPAPPARRATAAAEKRRLEKLAGELESRYGFTRRPE